MNQAKGKPMLAGELLGKRIAVARLTGSLVVDSSANRSRLGCVLPLGAIRNRRRSCGAAHSGVLSYDTSEDGVLNVETNQGNPA